MLDSRSAASDITAMPIRLALVPWMVAGVRTQYENLRAVPPPAHMRVSTVAIEPYKHGGLVERLPLLRSTHKGTIRSLFSAWPLVSGPPCDAIWTQALFPLAPLILSGSLGLKSRPAIVLTIDTTPALMDGITRVYYDRPPAGYLKRSLRDYIFSVLLRQCAAVTPWSRWAARSFRDDYGVSDDRIRVIPPGVNLDEWCPPPSTSGTLSRRPFRLLFVGADFTRKGGPLLLDVFRQELSETCELHLVTKAAITETPGIKVYRSFAPNAMGLRELYQSCDALVLPTTADCFSLAAIEAMACGLPVVSCPVGGIPEIVRHGETGYLVPPGDGRSLLQALRRLLDDRHLAMRMGIAGRLTVEDKFDSRKNTERLYQLLQQVAEGSKPRR